MSRSKRATSPSILVGAPEYLFQYESRNRRETKVENDSESDLEVIEVVERKKPRITNEGRVKTKQQECNLSNATTRNSITEEPRNPNKVMSARAHSKQQPSFSPNRNSTIELLFDEEATTMNEVRKPIRNLVSLNEDAWEISAVVTAPVSFLKDGKNITNHDNGAYREENFHENNGECVDTDATCVYTEVKCVNNDDQCAKNDKSCTMYESNSVDIEENCVDSDCETVLFGPVLSERTKTIKLDPNLIYTRLLRCEAGSFSSSGNPKCGALFTTIHKAREHLSNEHGVCFCPICLSYVSRANNRVYTHMKNQHILDSYENVSCPCCPRNLNYMALYSHLVKEHLGPIERKERKKNRKKMSSGKLYRRIILDSEDSENSSDENGNHEIVESEARNTSCQKLEKGLQTDAGCNVESIQDGDVNNKACSTSGDRTIVNNGESSTQGAINYCRSDSAIPSKQTFEENLSFRKQEPSSSLFQKIELRKNSVTRCTSEGTTYQDQLKSTGSHSKEKQSSYEEDVNVDKREAYPSCSKGISSTNVRKETCSKEHERSASSWKSHNERKVYVEKETSRRFSCDENHDIHVTKPCNTKKIAEGTVKITEFPNNENGVPSAKESCFSASTFIRDPYGPATCRKAIQIDIRPLKSRKEMRSCKRSQRKLKDRAESRDQLHSVNGSGLPCEALKIYYKLNRKSRECPDGTIMKLKHYNALCEETVSLKERIRAGKIIDDGTDSKLSAKISELIKFLRDKIVETKKKVPTVKYGT